jgi:hypothetical protein
MSKKKLLAMFEVSGYVNSVNVIPIRTHVRAINSSEARKLCMDRVPELIVTSVVPVGD